MFDLDMDSGAVEEALSSQDHSAALNQCEPGLRVAKGWSGFETAVATVLGQLVSVQFGRVLLKDLIHAYGATLNLRMHFSGSDAPSTSAFRRTISCFRTGTRSPTVSSKYATV